MKNKKALLKILEVFIAIILITGVLILLYSRVNKPNKSEEIYNLEKTILDEIAADPMLRNNVLNSSLGILSTGVLNNFVKERIPEGFNFTLRVCDIEDICPMQEYKEEVFATERIISSTLYDYEPKKLKVFMWKE